MQQAKKRQPVVRSVYRPTHRSGQSWPVQTRLTLAQVDWLDDHARRTGLTRFALLRIIAEDWIAMNGGPST